MVRRTMVSLRASLTSLLALFLLAVGCKGAPARIESRADESAAGGARRQAGKTCPPHLSQIDPEKAELRRAWFEATLLATRWRTEGKTVEAEEAYRKSLTIAEKAFGPGSFEVSSETLNLASLLDAEGKVEEAEASYRRAVALSRSSSEVFAKETLAVALDGLAVIHRNRERNAEAEDLFRQALAAWGEAGETSGYAYAKSLAGLAAVYKAEGRLTEAEPLYRHSVDAVAAPLGADHAFLVPILEDYASVLDRMRRRQEAEALRARAKRIRTRWGMDGAGT